MASANALGFLLPLGAGSAAVAGLSLARVDWRTLIVNFATGPGRVSRILLAFFVLTNWKSMPFVWTVRYSHPAPSHRRDTHLPLVSSLEDHATTPANTPRSIASGPP